MALRLQRNLSRREFLRNSALLAGAAVGLPVAAHREENAGLAQGGPRKRIIILGAGIAGLAAGYELKRAGHEVVVLEASPRAGGRVLTLRESFSDGLHAEAGAARFPPHHTLTFHYIRHFGLSTVPFYPTDGLDTYLIAGRRFTAPRGKDPDMSKLPLRLTDEERKLGLAGLYARFVGEPARPYGTGWDGVHPPEAAELGEITFYDFVRSRGASHDAARYLAFGFEHDSALDMVRDAAGHDVPVLFKIEGGNDQLPKAFARELRDSIHYGSPVERIASSEGSVEVTVNGAEGRHTIRGDYLICAIPFSVLRRVEIDAPLSVGKRAAIRESVYGHVTRLFAQMRRKFWRASGSNGFGYFDQPMELWDPTHADVSSRAILVGYTYEVLARRYAAMSPDRRLKEFVNVLEKVHPGAREHFETGYSWSWHAQPYQRGAFLLSLPGDFRRYYEASSQAEGRIHFAGEHTSPWPAWVQGALHSGLRVAREISEAA